MFVLNGACLICRKAATPKRQHWCDGMGYLAVIGTLNAINSPIHTSKLIDYLIRDKNLHPMWMSRTRAADFLARFGEAGIIRIKPDPIDPRKNVASIQELGLVSYKESIDLYVLNAKQLPEECGNFMDLTEKLENLLSKIERFHREFHMKTA